MRQIKRIGFFLYSCLLLAAGFYGHIKFAEMFYPGSQFGDGGSYRKEEAAESAAAAAAPLRITFDTELVILTFDLTSGETVQSQGKVPSKYMGLDREEFVRCVENEAAAPALSEREKGLFSIEVQSFSPQRIVIRKSYRKRDVAASFYLALRDHMVVVYEEDKSTVYMQTGIDGRTLPQPVRDELVYGMTLEGTEKLEAFLEEYARVPASE